MTTVRTVIHDRPIEVPAPEDLPDGTEVILTIGTDGAERDGPISPEEIARVLAAMGPFATAGDPRRCGGGP